MLYKGLSILLQYAKYLALGSFSLFFVLYGVNVLISSYGIRDPFYFIMTFFSSNLMILIGLVPLVGIFFRLYEKGKKHRRSKDGHIKDTVHRQKD